MMYNIQKIFVAVTSMCCMLTSVAHPPKPDQNYIKQALRAADNFLLKNSNLHRTINGLPAKPAIRTRNMVIIAAVAGYMAWNSSHKTSSKSA